LQTLIQDESKYDQRDDEKACQSQDALQVLDYVGIIRGEFTAAQFFDAGGSSGLRFSLCQGDTPYPLFDW
jgi:hypothetical protein